ncbi:MAG: rane protein [Geminicoccaceae bacterium]|nr:rane protein [Geminicoccaceae bacterium]
MPELEPLFWHWWAFGGALVIVEAFAPGFVFLWLGIAAALVGTLLWLWPGIGPDYQVLIFAALSVTSVLGWRRWRDAHPAPSDQPSLNRRGTQYIGRRFTLLEPIAHGRGRIRLGDSSWTGADGAVLQVRAATEGCATDRPRRCGAAVESR